MTTAITVTDEMIDASAVKLRPMFSEAMSRDIARELLEAALSGTPSAEEPVAYTSQFQLDGMIKNPSGNFVMWGELRPDRDDIPLFTHPSPSASEAKVRRNLVDSVRSYLDNLHKEAEQEYRAAGGSVNAARARMAWQVKDDIGRILSALSSDQVETAPQGTETPAGREHYLTAVQANELGIEWTPPSPSPSTPSPRKETER